METEVRKNGFDFLPYLLVMILVSLTFLPVGVAKAIPGLPNSLFSSMGFGEWSTYGPKVEGPQVMAPQVTQSIIEETADIPSLEIRRSDSALLSGKEKVVSEGAVGKKKVSIKVSYQDGKEIGREVTAETVVQPPLNRVIAVGTKLKAPASRGATASERLNSQQSADKGLALEGRKSIVMQATAYTHTGNRTATGIWPKVGVVAVDPRVIPLGTKLYVEGYGPAVAADTGGAIKGNIIDVFFDSNGDCIQWGRKNVKVYIVE